MFAETLGGKKPFVGGTLSRVPSPLPPEMLRGMDVQQLDFEGCQQSYMRGVTRSSGWPYYYLYALVVKMTIGAVIACVIGLFVALLEARRKCLVDSAVVLIPVIAILGVVSLKHTFTNHARYVLPCLPYLILCASQLAEPLWVLPTRVTRCCLAVLIASSTLSAAANYPHWLGYFNEAAGGPSRGWWHLEDSNVDWGQDFILLREWIDRNCEAKPIYVCSHHVIDPRVYLGERTSQRGEASYVAVNAYSLVHNERELSRKELVAHVGTSFFVFRVKAE